MTPTRPARRARSARRARRASCSGGRRPCPTSHRRYTSTLATLSDLTSARERRRIAAALQGGDELYRVLLRTVPDMVVALFDRDLRCQLVDGGMDTLDLWRETLEGKTVREALADQDDGARLDALLRPALDGTPTDFEWFGPRERLPPPRAGRPGARRSRGRDRRDGGLPRPVAARAGRRLATLAALARRPARPPRRAEEAPGAFAGTLPGMADVAMPRLSDSMEEGTILKWLKSDGDEVKRGEELVEIETDKANMTYESDSDGVLSIVAKEGDTLPVGETIARLGDGSEESGSEGGEDEEPKAEEPAAEEEQAEEEQPEEDAGDERAARRRGARRGGLRQRQAVRDARARARRRPGVIGQRRRRR